MAANSQSKFETFHRDLLEAIQARDGTLAANANVKADGAILYIDKYRDSVKTVDRGHPFRFVTMSEARRLSPMIKVVSRAAAKTASMIGGHSSSQRV